LRAQPGAAQLGIVMFATQYRNAPMAVSGQHAQLCFSRAGIGRIGNLGPRYDERLRAFVGTDETRIFDFHVVPRRFAPYLAIRTKTGAAPTGAFGPQDPQPGDDARQFWVPVHKLFSGPECLSGMNLQISFGRGMLNDELAAFHRFLDAEHLENNWSGEHLEQFPFAIRDERIGSLSGETEFGPGVLVPRPNTLVEEAHYKGARLTFPVDPRFSGDPANLQMSSLFVLPDGQAPSKPGYLDDAEQSVGRPAPEYINIRHRVVEGKIENLNDKPDLMSILARGNYFAQHYIDFSGDGWVAASCAELLKAGINVSVPAFCMVGLPDFLPKAMVEHAGSRRLASCPLGHAAFRVVADADRAEHRIADRLQHQRRHRQRDCLAAPGDGRRCAQRCAANPQRRAPVRQDRHAGWLAGPVRSRLGQQPGRSRPSCQR
jgi:hypothetical protein